MLQRLQHAPAQADEDKLIGGVVGRECQRERVAPPALHQPLVPALPAAGRPPYHDFIGRGGGDEDRPIPLVGGRDR